MSIQETREETEARLKAAYEQRIEAERREAIRNGSDAEYAAHKAAMLKTARATEIGKTAQRDTGNVVGLSDADYEKRKRGMLRASLYSRTR
ncbi:hypothetical protein [Paraburkholderia oxyphila]|uniref:hypothetical protein n=1 Tax=Paraburkholderia oxyphila TaxID=614212 RepID=UPI00047F662F|nr:hypothetical protein [Paraburkholderia oxyphila]